MSELSEFWETWEPGQYHEHLERLKSKRKATGRSREEHYEQVKVLNWANDPDTLKAWPELEWLFAIPNGGLRHISVAKQMKAEGVKPGVPDLFLPVAKGVYHGLWLEMKVGKNKLSQKQEAWLDYLGQAGYATEVCYNAKGAMNTIRWYMTLD